MVTLAVGAFAPAAGAAATPVHASLSHAGCNVSRSKTIVQTATIRVLRTARHYDPNYATGAHVDYVYACWRPSGKRTRVDIETPDGYFTERVRRVLVARDSNQVIGLESEFNGRGGQQDTIGSIDVRTGRTIHDNRRDVNHYATLDANLAISEFIVTRNGSLAWIGGGSCPSSDGLGTDGVYAIGTGQGERHLVCGDPNGSSGRRAFSRLRYAAGILTWQAAGGQMSARLS
jgi:hypothetical protein